jgi:hypothetical protein
MLAIVFDNWLEICFLFLVSSVQVAQLACVLIGSLAKLSSSFCKRSVLVPCRWLMLSLARWSHQLLLFGFKGPLRYLTLSWFSAKNEIMLWLTILVVLNLIRFWIEPFTYWVCCTRPRQVLDRTFCYQSLTVLDIQPPKTMNSVFPCKDELRVFLALSGNVLSMTLVPQDISHSNKPQISQWKKMGWCLRCKHATPQTPEILTMN